MLPQMSRGQLFVTDAGMETDLIFNRGIDLPEFAAFVLIDDEHGRSALADYTEGFVEIAREHGTGLILDTPTWRANRDWGEKLGYDAAALAGVNRRWMEIAADTRERAGLEGPVLLDGLIGPRGDGYLPGELMSSDEAAEYHSDQIGIFASSGADMVSVLTVNYAEEGIGVATAARAHGLPAVISFTVETDGRLPSGQPLGEAIGHVDAETGGSVAYFMVNCAHPTHFSGVLEGDWVERVRGVRANASSMSHAELDEGDELDDGDPLELASGYRDLKQRLPEMNVVGGCCGTDVRHVRAICAMLCA